MYILIVHTDLVIIQHRWKTKFIFVGGRRVFREFLRCEYSEENILFWMACEELKKVGPLKKDLYRREGKGRRCCLGDRIDQISCRFSARVIWRHGWIAKWTLGRMDDLPVRTTPNHHPAQMVFSPKIFLQIINGIQVRPPNSSDYFLYKSFFYGWVNNFSQCVVIWITTIQN